MVTDGYIVSVPQSSNAKKTSKHRKPPATPAKGNKKNKTVADVSTPSTVSNASPAKSYTSISSTEEEGTPTETKAYGWFGTDARVFSSPLKGSSR
ncbi:hypothetical protein DOTSEDRAFT_68575 [Dothistroma septosporum NZE10]|uniref:Uncharacterized protein n=1 Tax=Dothistroma septosporum (strain NZE10 / CBS 128990) TaxID=675120 RepID=N1Q4Y3_DOTSN|nr:hypothetical protein DOTSEDRAFT_68575 [Dothistroma septosporum NZE10]